MPGDRKAATQSQKNQHSDLRSACRNFIFFVICLKLRGSRRFGAHAQNTAGFQAFAASAAQRAMSNLPTDKRWPRAAVERGFRVIAVDVLRVLGGSDFARAEVSIGFEEGLEMTHDQLRDRVADALSIRADQIERMTHQSLGSLGDWGLTLRSLERVTPALVGDPEDPPLIFVRRRHGLCLESSHPAVVAAMGGKRRLHRTHTHRPVAPRDLMDEVRRTLELSAEKLASQGEHSFDPTLGSALFFTRRHSDAGGFGGAVLVVQVDVRPPPETEPLRVTVESDVEGVAGTWDFVAVKKPIDVSCACRMVVEATGWRNGEAVGPDGIKKHPLMLVMDGTHKTALFRDFVTLRQAEERDGRRRPAEAVVRLMSSELVVMKVGERSVHMCSSCTDADAVRAATRLVSSNPALANLSGVWEVDGQRVDWERPRALPPGVTSVVQVARWDLPVTPPWRGQRLELPGGSRSGVDPMVASDSGRLRIAIRAGEYGEGARMAEIGADAVFPDLFGTGEVFVDSAAIRVPCRALDVMAVYACAEEAVVTQHAHFADELRHAGDSITVLTMTKGKVHRVKWLSSDGVFSKTVLEVKREIQDAEGGSLSRPRLIFRGQTLEDHMTLEDNDIVPACVLFCVCRLRGGGRGDEEGGQGGADPTTLASFGDVRKTLCGEVEVDGGGKAPVQRVVEPGRPFFLGRCSSDPPCGGVSSGSQVVAQRRSSDWTAVDLVHGRFPLCNGCGEPVVGCTQYGVLDCGVRVLYVKSDGTMGDLFRGRVDGRIVVSGPVRVGARDGEEGDGGSARDYASLVAIPLRKCEVEAGGRWNQCGGACGALVAHTRVASAKVRGGPPLVVCEPCHRALALFG